MRNLLLTTPILSFLSPSILFRSMRPKSFLSCLDRSQFWVSLTFAGLWRSGSMNQEVEVLLRLGGLRMIESNTETPTIPALRANGTQ